MKSEIPLILPRWSAPQNVLAYCTTREGGFSQGNYAGLNVGLHVGDDAEVVLRNRHLLPASDKIHWLNQIHGADVVTLPTAATSADAAISRSASYYCAVMTADCVPVLLCDNSGKEVAAIHAGWKGLHLKIIEHTVAGMTSPPDQLMAWIGPAISQACYEVPESVATHFMAYPAAVVRSANPDKYLIDLPLVAKYQLELLGVGSVVNSALCTYQDPRFFSHRRATHNAQSQTGRIVSVIGLCA
ncbi:peptidoglycan editing factor PgeF [Alteromonas lipolytica]|uniref:Purine nucleoside phosphorylase n=1 Tax=Alteromonas lipolytica TaxID=1856405 RepID=A0A1E8F9K9_9ALTE|nr:peptidoglycan editing factor PgeF [Alteromonas lipolytica]OFI32476.1 hypothetical protein BFC17_04740 [Alteromonas lipolytica]GGF75836.1 laccase domain protein [Alteromonas lipolytica]